MAPKSTSTRLFTVLAALAAARATFLPPKNLTASVATLKAELNATKAALATEVALKLGGGATFDGTLPRFVGSVTCYVDDATGDAVGLQLGSNAPLCSTAGKRRTFAVPTDGYISDVKVAVDKVTGLVGELAFVVKSNASLVPTNIVTCGTRGGVGVSVMPKLAALADVSASCKPAQSGPQAALGLVLDPSALTVAATTVNAHPQGLAPTPAPTPPAPRYAYVANFGISPSTGNTVSVCPVSGLTGALLQCAPPYSASFSDPSGIAVSGGYAYVTNYGGGSGTTVSVCQVSGSTGALSGCTSVSGFSAPIGIAVSGGYAYVTNHGNGGSGTTVSVCQVSGSTGLLSGCTSASGFNGPMGIAVSGGYAYVTNYGNGGIGTTVSVCPVAPGSTPPLQPCTSATGFTSPSGIAVSGGFAYVTNYGGPSASGTTVSVCQVAPGVTPPLQLCTPVSGFFGPFGIAVSGGYAYVTNGNLANGNSVSVCQVVSGGTPPLTGCASPVPGFDVPFGIAVT